MDGEREREREREEERDAVVRMGKGKGETCQPWLPASLIRHCALETPTIILLNGQTHLYSPAVPAGLTAIVAESRPHLSLSFFFLFSSFL